MASRRTLLIGAAALIAADGAQAFAPSSLRAFGAAKAQLPARTCHVRSGLTSVKMAVAVWKEVQDPATGSIYYWNTQTGETSWDKPVAQPKTPPPPAGASLATYNGNGKYLTDEAVAALPKPEQGSLMPGYNVFGDGMFFGEGLLKGALVEQWQQEGIELDNWGNPLPTASEATKAMVAQAKAEAKAKELSNKSTFPYDPDSALPK